MMPTILPLTKVSERLGQIIRQAQQRGEPVFITRHGRAEAVLLTLKAYEALTKQPLLIKEQPFWYAVAQASLGRVWDHPDEDVYTLADGEPL